MRRKYHKKRDDKIILDNIKIIRIEEKNQWYKNAYKNVFYCESQTIEGGRMCIYWGPSSIEVGDTIEMKGFFSGLAFIVESLFRKNVGAK